MERGELHTDSSVINSAWLELDMLEGSQESSELSGSRGGEAVAEAQVPAYLCRGLLHRDIRLVAEGENGRHELPDREEPAQSSDLSRSPL